MEDDVGAILTDPSTDTTEVYVLPKGFKNKEVMKYNSTQDFIDGKLETTFQLPFPWTGTGHVVYAGCLYYISHVKNKIVRYDFQARRMRKQNEISDALMGDECVYENNEHSEIELAFDETGLWASYCQNGTHGNIVLSRLDMYTLERKRTYHSTMHKNWMVNSFIACGKFYGLRKWFCHIAC